jgi:hypothetical protein
MRKKLLFFLSAALSLGGFYMSCSTDTAIQPLLSSGSEGPVFEGYKAVSSGFEFTFSQPVNVMSATFNPAQEVANIENGISVKIDLQDELEAGMKLTADILVEDEHGNTLNVLVPVRSRNERMPQMVINEVRTEYAKPKVEFLEFKTVSAGNLAALQLFAAGISLDEAIYEFPSAKVKAGEYIVLYLRTLDSASVDETGSDLSLSTGAETSPTAREFWVPGTTKLSRKTEIFYLKDQDGNIIDAVMMNEKQNVSWPKENLAAAEKLLVSNNAWLGENPVMSQYATATRTICRDESLPDSDSAEDWYIAATSSATPGAANSSKKHEQKN